MPTNLTPQQQIAEKWMIFLENRIGRTLSAKEKEHIKHALDQAVIEATFDAKIIQP